ncbi:hypothetical protein NDU88_005190 [Pleurodeles waltl]|uniref:Uncharacterized protein n=1 Tax=Pleurodeles waltl TaxID=8319 RepID=A0AAV7UIV0_PLEWA|nr:hypothetical protein NDU88_005190 [Pleurodeles waltl]
MRTRPEYKFADFTRSANLYWDRKKHLNPVGRGTTTGPQHLPALKRPALPTLQIGQLSLSVLSWRQKKANPPNPPPFVPSLMSHPAQQAAYPLPGRLHPARELP